MSGKEGMSMLGKEASVFTLVLEAGGILRARSLSQLLASLHQTLRVMLLPQLPQSPGPGFPNLHREEQALESICQL